MLNFIFHHLPIFLLNLHVGLPLEWSCFWWYQWCSTPLQELDFILFVYFLSVFLQEYPERLQRLLLTPEREVAVELAILRDNGEVATFNAYRVQVRGRGCWPGGGGVCVVGAP